MNRIKLLVRQVNIRRGCWGTECDPVGAPTLVCPLCTLERKHPEQRTAIVARRTGHIQCLVSYGGCGRNISVFVRTAQGVEVPLYPMQFLKDPRTLETQSRAFALLNPALAGEGDLLDVVAMDDVQPQVDVNFVLPRITVDERLAGVLDGAREVMESRTPEHQDDDSEDGLPFLLRRGGVRFHRLSRQA